MSCTYVVVGLVRCVVDGGDYGSGRRACANDVGQSGVSRLTWSGKASSRVGGRARTVINGKSRFLEPLVSAENYGVNGCVPQ